MENHLSFTEFMRVSKNFRNKLIKFCIERGKETNETRKHLYLLDLIETNSEKDLFLRGEFYKWLVGKDGYKTIKLREICKHVGFDYWGSLENTNIIDEFDTLHSIHL